MPTVRVRPDVASVAFVDSVAVPLTPGLLFDTADPVVAAHPWAFEAADADIAGRVVAAAISADGTVEQMTAAPGERRRGRPPRVA